MTAEIADFHPTQARLAVDVRTGAVHCGGIAYRLTVRERELIVGIALQSAPIRAERLGELLYPDRDLREAVNAIKVTVYRLRRQISPGFIVHEFNGYRIGPDAAACWEEPSQALRRLGSSPRHGSLELESLVDFARLLRAELEPDLASFEWYACRWRTFQRQGRDLALAIARVALDDGSIRAALEIARELTYEDPCDEEAWELVVCAHLRQDHRAAAIRDFRIYEAALDRELGVEPSSKLRELVLGGPPVFSSFA